MDGIPIIHRIRFLLLFPLTIPLFSCTSPRYTLVESSDDGGDKRSDAIQDQTDFNDDIDSGVATDTGTRDEPQVNGDAVIRFDSSISDDPDTSNTAIEKSDSSVDVNSIYDARLVPIPKDASIPEDVETPEQFEDLTWAEPLLGRYALRADTFWLNQNFVVRNIEISLAEFVKEQEKIVLRVEICDRITKWQQFTIDQTSRLLHPEALGPRELEVAYDGEHWKTVPKSYYVGFQSEPLVPCEVGEIVSSHETQTWLRDGSCRCYSNEYLPQSPDDCRVVDHDNDGFPGVTLEVTGTVQNMCYTTTIRSDRYVKGTIDPSGNHHAFEAQDSPGSLLTCLDPNPLRCSIGETVVCKPEVNQVYFVPIESSSADRDEWNCTSVLANSNTLFTTSVSEISAGDC